LSIKEEENDSDLEEEAKESDEETTKKKSKRAKKAEKKREEKEIREKEESLLDPEREPETSTDYERLLLASPNRFETYPFTYRMC